jgi:hypothetical protein
MQLLNESKKYDVFDAFHNKVFKKEIFLNLVVSHRLQ